MPGFYIELGPFYYSYTASRVGGGRVLLPDPILAAVPGYNGNGYIAGEPSGDPLGIVQDKNGSPMSRPVWLLASRNKVPLRRVISGADGTYRFEHLNPDLEYTLVAEDDRRDEESAIADRIRPLLMP